MKVLPYLVPLASGLGFSAGGWLTDKMTYAPSKMAGSYVDFINPDGKNLNFLTVLLQLSQTTNVMTIGLLLLAYILAQMFQQKQVTLPEWANFLSANAISSFNWRAVLPHIVQVFGLDYLESPSGSGYSTIISSNKNKGSAISIVTYTMIFGLLKWLNIMQS